MSEKKEFDASLMDDFKDVEDFEGSIDDLDKVLETPVEDTQPTEEVTTEEVETVVETSVDSNKDINEMSIEELESLLQGEEITETVEVEEPKTEQGNGNLNVALHQAREEKRLLKQELDLIKQQMELLQVNSNTQPNQPVNTTNVEQPTSTDMLSELDDNDVISKADLMKLLASQQREQEQRQQQSLQQQNVERTLQLEKEFNETHGDDLGVLSYRNVINLHNSGKVKLTDGQIYDIQNAINVGKNPAEVLYETVINNVPALKDKKFKEEVKQLIKAKSKNAQPTVEVEQVDEFDDFSTVSNQKTSKQKLFDTLSDF